MYSVISLIACCLISIFDDKQVHFFHLTSMDQAAIISELKRESSEM